MFAIECPGCGSRRLVPPTRIRGVANTAYGIVVAVECWCGATVRLHTGRRANTAG